MVTNHHVYSKRLKKIPQLYHPIIRNKKSRCYDAFQSEVKLLYNIFRKNETSCVANSIHTTI